MAGRCIRGIACAGLLIFSLAVWAESTSLAPEELFEMPLEQLLFVSVASESPERLIHTPGIVSRYDMDEMQKMGFENLLEVLHFIPAVSVQRSVNGRYHIQMRGLSDRVNQKVLFLLNDTPYWMPSHAEIPLLGIPIESISHVEVLRGPGSVTYGTNASAGVVRVVTKEEGESAFRIAVGSHGARMVSGHILEASRDNYVSMSAELRRTEGYPAIATRTFELGDMGFTPTRDGVLRLGERVASVLIRGRYEGTTLTAHAFESGLNSINFSSLDSAEVAYQKAALLGLDHEHSFEGIDLRAFAEYNRYYRQLEVGNILSTSNMDGPEAQFSFADNATSNYRMRSGMHVSMDVLDGLRFLAGTEFEKRSTDAYVLTDSVGGAIIESVFTEPGQPELVVFPAGSVEEWSQFLQVDYQLERWRAVLGARYTDNQRYGSELTPRTSLMYRLSDLQSIKVMYSEGFNSPTFVQDIDIDSFGNPVDTQLRAEIVKTSDLAYSYESKGTLFVANFFYSRIKYLIGLEENAPGVPANARQAYYRSGIELDYQRRYKRSTVFSNFAWLKQGRDNQGSDALAAEAPEYTMGLGASYVLQEGHQLGFSQQWSSRRAYSSPNHQLNLTYRFTHGPNEASITLLNVYDRENLSPDGQFNRPGELQQTDRLSVRAGYRYRF